MTVKIDRKAGSDPRPFAQALVQGQVFPFWVSLTHKNNKSLVVPSSGINTPIAPSVQVKVKVKSFDQAWMLVTDLAELAHRAGNEADDFAELTSPEAPAPATGKATKPATKEAI